MKTLKEALNEQAEKTKPVKFYRFQLFVEDIDRKKTVGMAYLKEGQGIYTLRLWTLLEDKFFLLPSKDDSSKYLLMTREPNRSSSSKNKYFCSCNRYFFLSHINDHLFYNPLCNTIINFSSSQNHLWIIS